MQPVQAVVESFAQIDERLITDYHALCAGGIDGFGSDRYVPAWHDDVIDTGSVHFLLKKAEPFRFSDLIHGRCGGIRRQDVELVFPRKPPQFEIKQDLERNAKVDDPSIFLLTHDGASEDEKGELWARYATLDDLARANRLERQSGRFASRFGEQERRVIRVFRWGSLLAKVTGAEWFYACSRLLGSESSGNAAKSWRRYRTSSPFLVLRKSPTLKNRMPHA
jgi:hypothetical protein